jgi:hypothetical protein
MTFDVSAHLPVGMLTVTAVPPSAAEPKGTPLPPTVDVDSVDNPIPPVKTDH